jgi:hypothetical protein
MWDDANTRSAKSEGTAADERIVRFFRPNPAHRRPDSPSVKQTFVDYATLLSLRGAALPPR